MAQVSIPESISRMLYQHAFSLQHDFCVVDTRKKKYETMVKQYVKNTGYKTFVVKPDYTISKRGKNKLLGMNLSLDEILAFLQEMSGKQFQSYTLDRFLIIPYVPHYDEYYIAIQATSSGDEILFSHQGGMDVEDHWDAMRTSSISPQTDQIDVSMILKDIADKETRDAFETYIPRLFSFFRDYGFAYIEINPVVNLHGICIPLDFKGRLDDCEFFKLQKHINIYALLDELQEQGHNEEQYIKKLDEKTGASLKLKVLNRNGRIWPMIAGGGASIIYFDALVSKFGVEQIGMYGEYSGNPSYELTYEYAKTVIGLMLTSNAKNKVLLIGGGNANFTDIASTFKGIQQAIIEKADEIKRQNIQILVRRGGPNVKEAFVHFSRVAKEHGFNVVLEGVDTSLIHILQSITP